MALLFLVVTAAAQNPSTAGKSLFKNDRDKASYAFGMSIGRGWKDVQIDLDPEAVVKGLQDSLTNRASLTEAEMNETLAKFGQELRLIQQKHREQLGEDNLRQGEAFLAQNKTNQGVVSLQSGLQYKVLAQGAGESPDLTNWVILKFCGRRLNGAEFENSSSHPSQANIFSLGNVIEGWTEALQLMKSGAKWLLFVPPNLAYGKAGNPSIRPNETLIYELELVSILPGPLQPTAEDLKNERDPNGD